MAEAERLNVTQFAARADVDEKAVRRAINRGRLNRGADGLLDARQLGTRWRSPNARTREREPSRETTSDHAAVLLEKERSLAALRRLEFEQKSGTLIEIEVARRMLFEAARAARDAWLMWPARISVPLAARLGAEPDIVLRELTRLVYDQLGRMGEPGVDFGADVP
ncbi:hypothetical protein [Paraburkholderia sp. BR10882]|uniref:hypothetical protein n=1 Tax=unclassified Paraburkholderia TaxID=2615204 RepID=UPI0034CEF005